MKTGAQCAPRFRVIVRGEIALGPGKVQLLATIRETGSIVESAKRMGMSYMRAWTLLRTMNRCFKSPLVEAVRGGAQGGGARLTPLGNRILALYQKMERTAIKATDGTRVELLSLLAGSAGDRKEQRTAAGRVRAKLK